MQTSITEKMVYVEHKNKNLERLNEVCAETPCFTCDKLFDHCDEIGCHKLTLWAIGETPK